MTEECRRTHTCPYQYVGNLGYYNEPSTGLQYLRARWYGPQAGRFVSVDPIRDGVNWYGGPNAGTVVRVDPSGHNAGWDRQNAC